VATPEAVWDVQCLGHLHNRGSIEHQPTLVEHLTGLEDQGVYAIICKGRRHVFASFLERKSRIGLLASVAEEGRHGGLPLFTQLQSLGLPLLR